METPDKSPAPAHLPVPEYRCSECGGGIRRLQHLTYLTWFRDQLITVPNFPAWVCDLCGHREYDTRAVSWLNTILFTHKSHMQSRRTAYT